MVKWLLLIAIGIGIFFTFPIIYDKYSIWDPSDPSDDESLLNRLLYPLTPGVSPYVVYNDAGLQIGTLIVDVRNQKEYDEIRIPGAILIPEEELQEKIASIHPRKEAKVYVYDNTGIRGAVAARLLRVMGYDQAFYLQGGIEAWKKDGYATHSLYMFPE